MRQFLGLACITLLGLGFAAGYQLTEGHWERVCAPDSREAAQSRIVDLAEGQDFKSAFHELQEFSGCAEPSLEEDLMRAAIAYKIRDFHSAALFSTRAVQADPYSADAYNFRGQAYYEQRKFAAALHDLNRTLELEPDFIEAIRTRTAILKELNAPLTDLNRSPASNNDSSGL